MIQRLSELLNPPHNVILIETKFSNILDSIKSYLKTIVCDKTPYCNHCKYCKQIDNGNYLDLVWLNGYDNSIKKGDILNIQERFAQAASDPINKKIYVIQGIEKATPEALNSLLKFLEEPNTDNIYAVFSTKNINNILPTIRSRCLEFYLDSQRDEFINKLNQSKKYDEKQKQLILKVFSNHDEFKSAIADGSFNSITKFLKNLNKYKFDPAKIKGLADEFRKYDYPYIQKILNYLTVSINKSQNQLSLLKQKVNLTPPKILIFNELLNIVRSN